MILNQSACVFSSRDVSEAIYLTLNKGRGVMGHFLNIEHIFNPRDSYQTGRNPLYQSNCNQTLTETQIVRETLW